MKVLISQDYDIMINADRIIEIYIEKVEDREKDVYAIFAVVDFISEARILEMAYYYDERECDKEFHSIGDFLANDTIARFACIPRRSS